MWRPSAGSRPAPTSEFRTSQATAVSDSNPLQRLPSVSYNSADGGRGSVVGPLGSGTREGPACLSTTSEVQQEGKPRKKDGPGRSDVRVLVLFPRCSFCNRLTFAKLSLVALSFKDTTMSKPQSNP